MVDSSGLAAIREELKSLRYLYKKIADHHVLVEDPYLGDIEAVESKDDLIELDEVENLLRKPR